MRDISRDQVVERMRIDNPWWEPPHQLPEEYSRLQRRAYFDLFYPLLKSKDVRRAVVLMGPRRVGKTVLLHHAIQQMIQEGKDPSKICYFSVDHPIYNGLRLEELTDLFLKATDTNPKLQEAYVLFDEIQYLRDWEVHLKVLVDERTRLNFVGSGSAAAALRLMSMESGAGRFTDFLLPPLTFHEYLTLRGERDRLVEHGPEEDPTEFIRPHDIDALNSSFSDYVNYGGYPEVLFSETIRADPQRFLKNDIVDKVLLRDLPGLYGITDVQELNYLFTTLAFNTAQEVSLEELSKNSGVAKNTLKKYIQYLEAAFLIKVVHRIDHNGRRFKRANFFKVYLTNPSIRTALFAPVNPDDEFMGFMAETAIFSQWFHMTNPRFYARWKNGEVDIVELGADRPQWAVEIKWSDRYFTRPEELASLLSFCEKNGVHDAAVTTRTLSGHKSVRGVTLEFVPASVYCYTVGYNILIHQQLRRMGKVPN